MNCQYLCYHKNLNLDEPICQCVFVRVRMFFFCLFFWNDKVTDDIKTVIDGIFYVLFFGWL